MENLGPILGPGAGGLCDQRRRSVERLDEGEYTYRTIEQGKFGELKPPTPNYKAGRDRGGLRGVMTARLCSSPQAVKNQKIDPA